MQKRHFAIAAAALSVAAVAATFGLLSGSASGPTAAAQEQGAVAVQSQDRIIRRATLAPVVSDGAVKFKDRDIPVRAEVTSVGMSMAGLVITEEDNGLGNLVHIHDADGDPVADANAVKGIALTDPTGIRAAWVEYTSSTEEGGSQVVAMDVASGRILGRAPVTELARVTAVSGRDVAISDGDDSFLWRPGEGMTHLAFVSDDYYIVAVDAEHVVASDLNGATDIFTRTGDRAGTATGLISWDLDGAGRLVGATEQGSLNVIDIASKTASALRPRFAALSANWTSQGTVVATSAAALMSSGDGYAVCTLSGECSALSNGGAPYAPNDVVGQLVAQSR